MYTVYVCMYVAICTYTYDEFLWAIATLPQAQLRSSYCVSIYPKEPGYCRIVRTTLGHLVPLGFGYVEPNPSYIPKSLLS